MAKQVNATYGDALFDLAVEQQQIDVVLDEMKGLQQILKENEELLQMLVHPEILKEQKLEMIQKIFEHRISDAVMGTLMIVVQNDRSKDLPAICDYVIGKIKEYKKIGIADVISAMELSKEQKASIENKLIATTEYESMEMNYTVDASIIGGLIIRIEDRVVDSSIRRQLERMSAVLSRGEA